MRIKIGAMVIVLIFSSLNLAIIGENPHTLVRSDEIAFTNSEPVNLVTASTSKNIYGQGIAKLNNGWVVAGDLNTSSTDPFSTMLPIYMTTTSSANSVTTPMS